MNTYPNPPEISRVELQRIALPGDVSLDAVQYLLLMPPGSAGTLHTHPGIGLGYIIEGTYETQYEGEESKTFSAGDAVCDLFETPHVLSRNPSETEWLKIVLTFVVPTGSPTLHSL